MPQKKRSPRTLREYLDRNRVSRAAFARKLGVRASYVSMIAGGLRTPSLPIALQIHELTGVPVESLMRSAA